jgi:hypothetical protein
MSGTDSVRLVSEYLADFDATTQRRSAMVLGDIGSSGAVGVLREALDSALTRQYRRDVVRAIHEALATATLPPFGGRVSDSVPDFLDTVVVRAAPGLAWDGDESVALPGTPFGDSLLIQRWSDDSLSLVAVGEAGRYALSVGNIGPNQVAQRQRIHIRSFPAPPSDEVPEVAAAQLPLRLYLSLARGTQPADTSSFFRFRPLVDLPVTAAVEWTGPAQIDLSWEDCTERSFPGPPLRISGVVMDESGQPIGAAAVRLLGTAFAAVTDGFGRFSMDVPAGRTGDLRVERAGYQPAQRPAAEGRHYWVVLYQAAAPAPFPGQVISLASPGSSTITIPARSCRLLGLVQTDPAASAVIVRLRITSP